MFRVKQGDRPFPTGGGRLFQMPRDIENPSGRRSKKRTWKPPNPAAHVEFFSNDVTPERWARYEEIVAAWEAGEDTADICRRFDIAPNTIQTALGILRPARRRALDLPEVIEMIGDCLRCERFGPMVKKWGITHQKWKLIRKLARDAGIYNQKDSDTYLALSRLSTRIPG